MEHSIFYFAANVGVTYYKLQKGGCQEECRRDEQSFIELLISELVFFC